MGHGDTKPQVLPKTWHEQHAPSSTRGVGPAALWVLIVLLWGVPAAWPSTATALLSCWVGDVCGNGV